MRRQVGAFLGELIFACIDFPGLVLSTNNLLDCLLLVGFALARADYFKGVHIVLGFCRRRLTNVIPETSAFVMSLGDVINSKSVLLSPSGGSKLTVGMLSVALPGRLDFLFRESCRIVLAQGHCIPNEPIL